MRQRDAALEEALAQGTIERGAHRDDVDVGGDDVHTLVLVAVEARPRERRAPWQHAHDARTSGRRALDLDEVTADGVDLAAPGSSARRPRRRRSRGSSMRRRRLAGLLHDRLTAFTVVREFAGDGFCD
ncbi:MAG: hypothetical protein Q8O67_22750 [Deltaproteobacteria bacterium]|nr:hypothetical protein [Deltaproteobacteria bacterium]